MNGGDQVEGEKCVDGRHCSEVARAEIVEGKRSGRQENNGGREVVADSTCRRCIHSLVFCRGVRFAT